MIKIIEKQAAQGDVMFRRIDVLPADATPCKAVNGAFVVAHSETGHNHIVMERPTVKMFSAMDEFCSYLIVEDKPAKVEHQRSFDTHQSFALARGIWEVRRQREYVPDGFRRAAD
jgi:hypothetical protein